MAEEDVGILPLQLANGEALPTGVYLLKIEAGDSQDARYWQNRHNLLIVADTNLVINETLEGVHVWATDLATGQPVSGRSLTLYNRLGVELATAVSDAQGLATFDYDPPDGHLEGVTVVSNTPGSAGFGVGSSLWSGGFQPWRLGIQTGYGQEFPTFAYIYTDRPIYRPGDTIYYKGIVRSPGYGRYNLPETNTLDLHITPRQYFESPPIDELITVELDADGSFSGEFVLPEDVTLGGYQFTIEDNWDATRPFSVADYRKPEFQISMTADKPEALRGESVDVTLATTYFFGASAGNLKVYWTIYEDTYHPDAPVGPRYAFGDRADFFYEPFGPFGGPGGGAFGNHISSGEGETDENGNLIITLPRELLDDVEEGSRKVTVEAFVADLAEFPIISSSSVIFHAAETYVGIAPTDYLTLAGTETSVDIVTVDWEGQPDGGKDVEVIFYQREWQPKRVEGFGSYYTEWEAIDTEVARAELTTNAAGKGSASFIPEGGGNYLAIATVSDGDGRKQSSSTTIWAIDANFIGWRSDPHDRTMELTPDQSEYHVGDTARVLVQSPFAGATQAWLIIERGEVIEQRIITLNGGSEVVDIPIEPIYAPNVHLMVIPVKPATLDDADNPFADIRIGITELVVSPEQLELNVELTPRQERFEPGETAVYDILVTDFSGNPVAADLSLALVDLAVLTLKDDNAPPILEAFYSRQPYRSNIGAGLLISGEGLEAEIPLAGGGGGGGGGDGMAESATAKLGGEDEEDSTRQDFPDTAFWQAQVKTAADGTASVEIPLPDSLTTWRLSSKAVTADSLVGQAAVDVIVSLPLLIRPVTPRFFTVGDVLQLGAIVNNNTSDPIEATVLLDAEGVVLSGDAEQSVVVDRNGRQLIRWEVTVEDVPTVNLTFRVEGGGFSDATKPTLGIGPDNRIPVYRYDAEDFVGTSGVLDEAGRRVEAVLLPDNVDTRRGSVEVEMSPSLAAALLDGLTYLHQNENQYPQCAHAITNRLLPNVATAVAIQELSLDKPELVSSLAEQIPSDISRLEGLAKAGGGWGYCFNRQPNSWLTAYSLLALAKAEEAGYQTNAELINRAQLYLERQLKDSQNLVDAFEVNRQAFFIYVLAETDWDGTLEADMLFSDHRGLLNPYARALLAQTYALNDAASSPNVAALLADLNDSVVLSASGAHWEDASPDRHNLSSDVRGTAIIIDVLSRMEPDNGLLPQAVRWLMLARTAQHWPTHHETAWSIFALSHWMAASGELDAAYPYQLNLNATPLAEGQFGQENISDNITLSVPIRNLLKDDVNFFDFQRGDGGGKLYYTLFMDSFIAAESVQPVSNGITVQRVYTDAACDPTAEDCQPLDTITAGQQVRVELTVIAANDLLFAVVEDPIPAGVEAIDPGLATTSASLGGNVTRSDDEYRFGYWGWQYFNHIEYRDEKVVFTASFLPAGTYQYTYFLQTNIPGSYQVMPTIAYEEFFVDVNGRSAGMLFTIEDGS